MISSRRARYAGAASARALDRRSPSLVPSPCSLISFVLPSCPRPQWFEGGDVGVGHGAQRVPATGAPADGPCVPALTPQARLVDLHAGELGQLGGDADEARHPLGPE